MDFNVYTENVSKRLQNRILAEELNAYCYYEEHFRAEWLFVKLKQFSFLSFKETINLSDISSYSQQCMNYALKHYKGLPRGIQNGIVSVNVLAGLNIKQDAVDFVLKSPRKKFSAFELPVIADLKNDKLIYINKTPVFGAMYYGYIKQFAGEKFAIL